jgi:hypothetical protein
MTLETSRELSSRIANTQTVQNIVEITTQVTYLSILLTVPFLFVLVGLGVALLSFRIAYSSRRAILRLGKIQDIRVDALRYKERELLVGILIVLTLCIWYIPVILVKQPAIFTIGLPLGLSLLSSSGAIASYLRSRRATRHYYEQLPIQEQTQEQEKRKRATLISMGGWLLVVLLALLIGQFDFALFPRTAAQWFSDATLTLLLLWPLLDIADYLWIRGLKSTKSKE